MSDLIGPTGPETPQVLHGTQRALRRQGRAPRHGGTGAHRPARCQAKPYHPHR